MSLVIVGSIAFDTVDTPFGSRERIVGGSGTYCVLSAAYFSKPGIVAVVGSDFPAEALELMKARGIDIWREIGQVSLRFSFGRETVQL
mgnify:CR=1 FL=1